MVKDKTPVHSSEEDSTATSSTSFESSSISYTRTIDLLSNNNSEVEKSNFISSTLHLESWKSDELDLPFSTTNDYSIEPSSIQTSKVKSEEVNRTMTEIKLSSMPISPTLVVNDSVSSTFERDTLIESTNEMSFNPSIISSGLSEFIAK